MHSPVFVYFFSSQMVLYWFILYAFYLLSRESAVKGAHWPICYSYYMKNQRIISLSYSLFVCFLVFLKDIPFANTHSCAFKYFSFRATQGTFSRTGTVISYWTRDIYNNASQSMNYTDISVVTPQKTSPIDLTNIFFPD